jgi:NhaP-type Na+/H+ or K+/H+ antiporter
VVDSVTKPGYHTQPFSFNNSQTLVHFLDESLVIDQEAVIAAAIHFLVVAFGSLCVGIGSGFSCTVYYWLMQGCQTPLVEVLLFFCWAFIPYYICDGIGWSGIVAVVATGFIMDIYVVGQGGSSDDAMHTSRSHDTKGLPRRSLFTTKGHLSSLAKTHVGFVAELLSTMMETAIFAYLGVFLFSYRYHWNFMHTFLAIFACCISRAIMIPLLSLAANWVAKVQQARAVCHKQKGRRGGVLSAALSPPAVGVVIDNKMQLVLWVAGLRGAMSFALVENIPLYDTVTGQGSRLKPELKAMTSATIVFTVFILGGYTYYLMEHLGMKPKTPSSPEMTPLVKRVSEAGLAANNTPFDDANDRSSVRHRPKDKLHG